MIKIIIEKRSDAIHVYNKFIISELKLHLPDIEVICLDNKKFKGKILNTLLELYNTIRLVFLIKKNDTILFTDPLPIYFLSSLFIKNRKFVIFFHYEKDPFYYKFLPFNFKWLMKKFDGIICSSEYSLSQLKNLGISLAKCKIVYCGVNHQLFMPTSKKLEGYPSEYILSIGSEEPRKNMANILKAFLVLKKDFPNLKLIKTGKASHVNRKNTLYWVNQLGLKNDIIFTEFVDEKDLPTIYSNAKLLLFPSLLEGFGLPIIEAMASGCPVVTSSRKPMSELIGEKTETVDPTDPQDIAMACKKILSDASYKTMIIEDGIKKSQQFTWQKAGKEVAQYIQ